MVLGLVIVGNWLDQWDINDVKQSRGAGIRIFAFRVRDFFGWTGAHGSNPGAVASVGKQFSPGKTQPIRVLVRIGETHDSLNV